MNETLTILGLMDLSTGYGSPQITQLHASLLDHFAPARCILVEPDQKGRRVRAPADPRMQVVRIGSRFPPHDQSFHIEYNRGIRRILECERPDVVVLSNAWAIPGLLLSGHRPRLVIYQMLESLSHQFHGGGQYFIDLNHMVSPLIDLVIVPEIRRFRLDVGTLGWEDKPVVECLNVPMPQASRPAAPTAPAERTCRLLYAGSLGSATLCERFLDCSNDKVEFHLAGPADSQAAQEFLAEMRKRGSPRLRYLGLLTGRQVAELRPRYAYAPVMWRPDNANQVYASPNKLFETIAAGVPPICAPHPQCVDVIRRFDCGLLMDEWNQEAFDAAIARAVATWRTPAYEEMVQACLAAHRTELNWAHQFAKVAAVLPGLR